MAFSKKERLRHKVLAVRKWAQSYFVSDWELQDYPVVLRKQERPGESVLLASRFKPQPYWAFIVGANLGGGGETSDDALASLRTNFKSWKQTRLAEGKSLPRPGTSVPIEFADSSKVDAHGALAEDFIHRVLQLDWAMITDESSLWDFHEDMSNDNLNARVKDVYGIDVSDIESGNLSSILDRIAASRSEG